MEDSQGIRMPPAFLAVSRAPDSLRNFDPDPDPDRRKDHFEQQLQDALGSDMVSEPLIPPRDLSASASDGDHYTSGAELTPIASVQRPSVLGIASLEASTTSFATVASAPLAPNDVDRYGFKKSSARVPRNKYDSWAIRYASYVNQRRSQWHKLMVDSGLNPENPVRFPARSRRTTRYIRKGIPPEWRGAAWWWYAGGPERLAANAGVYDGLVKDTQGLRNSDTEHIERDLHRTFPDNIHFRPIAVPSNGPGGREFDEGDKVRSLRRVLTALSVYCPKIGYCQSLNFIAANLLLFLNEEKTFWMLVIITQQYLVGLHEINLEEVNIYQGVLMVHIRDRLPKVWQAFGLEPVHQENFVSNLPPISLCSASWFMSLFVAVLPTETTLRVWDCFFYEGLHTLFRVALTIFKLCEPELAQAEDEAAVFQCIQQYPQSLVDPALLLGTCYRHVNGFGHPTEADIRNTLEFVAERRRAVREAEALLPPGSQARWEGYELIAQRRLPLLSVLSVGGVQSSATETTDREEYARFRPRSRIKSRLHLYR